MLEVYSIRCDIVRLSCIAEAAPRGLSVSIPPMSPQGKLTTWTAVYSCHVM